MENEQKDARDLVLIFLAVFLVCIYLFRERQQYSEDKAPMLQRLDNSSGLNGLNGLNPVLTNGEAKQVLGIKIDINKATQSDLESLPNVGPKLAKNIIEKRNEVGGFKSIDDIKKVKGIGEKKFEKIKDLIGVR
ncbi:MAG: helix-hairpin-helix domain-containing protein [Deltaproteobacteria bacterium]|nr:helix-hairpin-helix domain-containing protein [Deltaproteobacteria bacterium]